MSALIGTRAPSSTGDKFTCFSRSIVVSSGADATGRSTSCVHRKTAAIQPVKPFFASANRNSTAAASSGRLQSAFKPALSGINKKKHLAQLRGTESRGGGSNASISMKLCDSAQQSYSSSGSCYNLVSNITERSQKHQHKHNHHYNNNSSSSEQRLQYNQSTFSHLAIRSSSNRMPPVLATCFGACLASGRRHSSWTMLACAVLVGLLTLGASGRIGPCQLAAASTPSSNTKGGNEATIAYSEPIKWSFGGWAPLDGGAAGSAQQVARLNGSSPQRNAHISPAATSPMPSSTSAGQTAQQRTTPAQPAEDRQAQQAQQVQQQQQQARQRLETNNQTGSLRHLQVTEPMSESASSARDNVQFSLPPQQQQLHQTHHLHHQHHSRMMPAQSSAHGLPAYALPMLGGPQQFSAPAPPPIFRDQLLPAANHNMPNRKLYRPEQMHASHAAMLAAAQQHHQQQMMAANHLPGLQMRRPSVSPPIQRLMHQHHRQQMQQHMMRHRPTNHRHHPRYHQHQHKQHHGNWPQPQPYRQPAHMMPDAAAQRAIPRYPGSPFMHSPQSSEDEQPAHVGAFKIIEAEQPIMFTNSLTNGERLPMIEVSAQAGGYRNESDQQQMQQQQQQQQDQEKALREQTGPNTPASEPYPQSTLAAIEKDNLNYQSALRQVSNMLSEEQQQQQQQQSNNIQDIKQRQQKQQQQYEQANVNKLGDKQAAGNSKPSYLTIPVAVETEGDKVLTSEDINEIEKHVINVLPSLKTADKIVKIADAHLTMANLKSSPDSNQPKAAQNQGGPEMHQMNYEEHRSTLKQLEGDLNQQTQYEMVSTPATPSHSGYRTSATAPAIQATVVQHPRQQQEHADPNHHHHHHQQQQQQQVLTEHQYYLATGPLQEMGSIDPDQVADYNLIKNDLLNNFRYEPTRASSSSTPSSSNQPSGTTPPMPYQAAQRPKQQQHLEQPYNRPSASSSGPASVTRYFQQGAKQPASFGRATNLFARLNGPRQQEGGYNQLGATTKTIMGGRKVSEVMRPLIHTTPVPMTSHFHVPSVEPEKVDAIQLIAGNQANDKRPMVVEAHQLINHTPDGGIDYNSGMPPAMMMEQHQHQNQHTPPVADQQQQNQTQQQANHLFEHQQQQSGQMAQYDPSAQDGDNQGAIIEYVAMTDQALSNAVQQQQQLQPQPQHQHQHQQQQQQRHPEPDPNNNSNQAPFLYDYTMSTQHQTSVSYPGASSQPQPPTTPTYLVSGQEKQQQVQVQAEPQPSLAWSPSVASEHQQQQMELSEHAAPMQQMEMPATAGYNLFGGGVNQQEQLVTNNGQQQQQQLEHYGQQQQQQHDGNRWRTKAGGSQPNPDAQYDGQMVKGSSEQEVSQNSQQEQLNEEQRQQEQYDNHENQPQPQGADLGRLNSRPQEEHEQQQQQQLVDNGNEAAVDGYQQQQQPQRYQGQSNGNGVEQQQQTGPPADYLATSSFVGGAQINGPASTQSNYDQPASQQQYTQAHPPSPEQFTYMKLDRDRQQSHLQQHQAQHQAQLAEMMGGQAQQQQPSYQTTTPMSITTLAAIEQQEQQANKEQDLSSQQQEVPAGQNDDTHNNSNNNNNNGYMVEQVQSRPSVQSSPDSMLINESPIQVPITDQQSLISDQNQNSNDQFSDDDGAKQRQHSQPAGVYQVYQAYYAPKDHKPLPGYVRLSLEEFNELFRDAEIQYVDRSLNGLTNGAQSMAASANNQLQHLQQPVAESMNNYEQQASPNDLMKASASESQTIVVDRRSISERRSSNSTSELSAAVENNSSVGDKNRLANTKLKQLNRAVKKIISIRNSRQSIKQAQAPTKLTTVNRTSDTPQTTSSPTTTIGGLIVEPASSKGLIMHHTSKRDQVNIKPHKHVMNQSVRKAEATSEKKNSAQQQQSAKLAKALKLEPSAIVLHKPGDKQSTNKIVQ